MRNSHGSFRRISAITFALSLFVIFQTKSAFSQNIDRDVFNDAEYYIAMNDYEEALPLFLQLYSMDSTNHNINYRIGLCYLNIYGKKSKSIKYLEYAIKNTTPKYHEGSYKERNAPNIAIFNLGEAYMLTNQLDVAVNYFNLFKQKLESDDDRINYINQQIEACYNAKQMMETPLNIEFHEVIPSSTQKKSFMYPILSGDKKTLVYTAKEKFYDAIYCCRWNGESWGAPYNATLDLALEGEIYATSLNHNGTSMLVFQNEISMGNIFVSNFANGKWSKAQKIQGEVNSKNWETFASLSEDGNTLVFTSNRKNGVGNLDIYTSTKGSNGLWSIPQNIGSTVNTKYNEESPILTDGGKTLYFASQGHNSIGGFDIFVSRQTNNGTWSEPVNLGYPLNTTDDEIFLFPIDSANALVSIIDPQKSTLYEIRKITYHVAKPVLKVELTVNVDFEGSGNYKITIKDGDNKSVVDSTIDKKSTKFTTILEPNTYTIDVLCDGYKPAQTSIYIPNEYAYNSMTVDMQLNKPTPIVENKTVVHLNNILFGFDSYKLDEQSISELAKVQKLMAENPNVRVRVIGRTDNKGSSSYNLKLSNKRANSVVDYLVNNGISSSRFEVKSVGAFANIATNTKDDGSDNPEGRKLNRCVQLEVVNHDANVEIEFAKVPERLQPNNQVCLIILSQQNAKFTETDIQKALSILQKPVVQHNYNNEYFLCSDSYLKKIEALADLNKIIDLGYADAYIGNERELKRLCNYKNIDKN